MSLSDGMPASMGTTLEDTTTASACTTFSNPIQARPLLDAACKNGGVVTSNPHIPSVSASAVLGESASMPPGSVECRGHDFNQNSNRSNDNDSLLDSLMQSFVTTGFQATQLGLAVERVRELRAWRLSQVPASDNDDDDELLRRNRHRIRARIFLAYTSNQISSGQREVLRFLVQHGMVDCLITTAGGVEEDLIKCLRPTYMGDFRLSGRELRSKGLNRIGNLLVPNRNYCDFEDWLTPILQAMHDEQDAEDQAWVQRAVVHSAQQQQQSNSSKRSHNLSELPERFAWTPSSIIRRLGLEINHPDSVLYWAAVNNIPVFCPALTDGSFGDMLYFHSYQRPGFILDIARDIRGLNDLAVQSHCTGQIILGGGLVKHHTCNANLMRNGADYSIYINTACDFDGSDSGASPDEAVSWGKIRMTAQPVKVTADATIAFPLLVAASFAKNVDEWKESVRDTVCWHGDLAEESAER